MAAGDSNGRVTMAVLGARLEAYHEDVRQLCARYDTSLADHEARLRDIEREQTRHGERLKVQAIAQGVATAIASAVAAVIGVFK